MYYKYCNNDFTYYYNTYDFTYYYNTMYYEYSHNKWRNYRHCRGVLSPCCGTDKVGPTSRGGCLPTCRRRQPGTSSANSGTSETFVPAINVVNLFSFVNGPVVFAILHFLHNLWIVLMSVRGKPFQPSQMFASKAVAYLSEASFSCSTLG